MINVYLFLYYTIILFPLQLDLHFIVKGLGIRPQVSYKKEKSHKHWVYRTLYLILNSIQFVMYKHLELSLLQISVRHRYGVLGGNVYYMCITISNYLTL